jgi:hypothetical protein
MPDPILNYFMIIMIEPPNLDMFAGVVQAEPIHAFSSLEFDLADEQALERDHHIRHLVVLAPVYEQRIVSENQKP